MEIKRSLPPVINSDSRILILGSMPGEESLRLQQYYAYPQNHFWKLIAALLGADVPLNYEQKIQMVLNSRIALWDLIDSCLREGSLDTNIRNENYNGIPDLLGKYNGINAVFFNGQKAAAGFKKAFGFNFLQQRDILFRTLPSSSPANTIGFDRKLEKWNIIGDFF